MKISPAIWIMVVVALVATITLLYFPSEGPKTDRAQEETRREQHLQSINKIVGAIEYIKDPRAGVCFAYYWNGRNQNLSTVPCESIPPHLLTVAQ